MTKVRIVGGGLMGVLAALEAHRLGARVIELHDHLDQLGGQLLPRVAHGLELRDRRLSFGGREDPIRKLLEWRGVVFEDVEDHCGSISPSLVGEPTVARGFAGPVLQARDATHGRLTGEALTDRLRAYPTDFHAPLTRYCQWRLGVWLDQVHASAAVPIGLEHIRVRSAKADDAPAAASVPQGGFATLFQSARRGLEGIGVDLRFNALVSPREILDTDDADTVTVWTAPPTRLFRALRKVPPAPVAHTVASYIFPARYAGPVPFQLQNFTAEGSVFRLSLYESRGEILLCAECVGETPENDLRREIAALMAAFDGESLKLGDGLATHVVSRFDCLAADAPRKLAGLRSALAKARGPTFVTGAWETWDAGERFRKLARSLATALAEDLAEARSAA